MEVKGPTGGLESSLYRQGFCATLRNPAKGTVVSNFSKTPVNVNFPRIHEMEA